MDGHSRAARELLEILRLAGTEWMARPWRTCTVEPSSEADALGIDKPAFCYFWEAGDSPVEVAFVTRGGVPARKSRTLLIEVGMGSIRIAIPGRPPLLIPDLEVGIAARMSGLIPLEKDAAPTTGHPWHDELERVSAAMRLIVLARRAALDILDSADDAPVDSAVARRLHDWFDRTAGSPAQLADAAKLFGRNPRQFIRLLKKTTGTGFTEHLNLHRLMRARSLLMRTDRSVVDIARECGFRSREPFIRSFSKALGWTPLQFRKAWMQASISGEEAPELFRIADRSDVQWLPAGEPEAPSQPAGKPVPITLVVGNALREIVELSEVTPHRRHLRHDLLEHGRMIVIPETHGGTLWHVHAVESRRSAYFQAPDSPARAVISSDTLGGE